jgi:hypothetical protein
MGMACIAAICMQTALHACMHAACSMPADDSYFSIRPLLSSPPLAACEDCSHHIFCYGYKNNLPLSRGRRQGRHQLASPRRFFSPFIMWGVIKRDLADFVTQVRDEAAEAVKSIVDLSAEEAEQGENPAPPVAAMVRAFRLDENTYRDAIGVAEQADFDTFCGGLEWIVEGDQKDEEIVKNPELLQLLEEDSGMQTIHEQLVPAVGLELGSRDNPSPLARLCLHLSALSPGWQLMTDRVFWSRYLFRYNRLINQKERAGLLALALERNDDDEDLGGWDDDQVSG